MISASLAFTRPLISRLSVVFGIAHEYVRFQLCNMVTFVHSANSLDTWFTLWITSPVSRPVSELMTAATRATTTTSEGLRSMPCCLEVLSDNMKLLLRSNYV